MIKSKYNTFASWLLFSIIFFSFLILLTVIPNQYLNLRILRFKRFDNYLFGDIIPYLSSVLFIFSILLSFFVKKIIINPIDKTIRFQNLVTRQIKSYSFSDFDGFLDTTIEHRGMGFYKTIGLIKNKKVVGYIDSFFYSNFDELRNELKSINYLGTKNFKQWEKIKFYFGIQIMD